jgi:predicted transcriptional regulator
MWFFDMPRTKFGKWLRRNKVSQQWLVKESGVSKNTINSLALDEKRKPTAKVARKIINALKKIDPNISAKDFWM